MYGIRGRCCILLINMRRHSITIFGFTCRIWKTTAFYIGKLICETRIIETLSQIHRIWIYENLILDIWIKVIKKILWIWIILEIIQILGILKLLHSRWDKKYGQFWEFWKLFGFEVLKMESISINNRVEDWKSGRNVNYCFEYVGDLNI